MKGRVICMHCGKYLHFVDNVKFRISHGVCKWCYFKIHFLGMRIENIRKWFNKY